MAKAWSTVCRNPENYLQGGEFLLADSAYPLTEHTIVPFKRSSSRGESNLSQQKKQFNQALSGLHVSVENCIGRLKARFPSLRALPHRIRGRKDIILALNWIGSCVILHNLLIDLDDEVEACWERLEDSDEDSDEEEDDEYEGLTGIQKRDALMLAVLE